jgi:hypothetical protein
MRSGSAKRRAARNGRLEPRAKKISITVDSRILSEVEQIVRSEGGSLSAHIAEALARDLRRRRMQELIDEYEQSHGEISERELGEIRTEWQG